MASKSELVVDVSFEACQEARQMTEDAIGAALQLAREGRHDAALRIALSTIFRLYYDLADATAVHRMVHRDSLSDKLDS